MLAGKSRGGTPFCRMWKTVFPKRSLLGIPPESGSARLGHIPSLPWESQLPLKPCPIFTTFSFSRQLRFFRYSLRFSFSFIVQFCYLLRKCGLLAHTSPAFLKNCWCKKLLFACGSYLAATSRFTEKLSFLCFPAAFRLSTAFLVPIARFLPLFVKCFRSLPTFHRKISDKSPAFFLEITSFQTNFCDISEAIMIFAEILRKYFVEISKKSCYNEGNQKDSIMTHERKGTS